MHEAFGGQEHGGFRPTLQGKDEPQGGLGLGPAETELGLATRTVLVGRVCYISFSALVTVSISTCHFPMLRVSSHVTLSTCSPMAALAVIPLYIVQEPVLGL